MTEQKEKEGSNLWIKLAYLVIVACLMLACGLIGRYGFEPNTGVVEKQVFVPGNGSIESGTIDPSNATKAAIATLGGEGKVEILKQEENVTTHKRVVTQVLLKDSGTSHLKPEEREVTKDNVTYILGDKVVRMDTSQIITLVAEENSTSKKVAKP